MKYYTEDISRKAESIADREAESIWIKFHDYDKWIITWREIYFQTLLELSSE